MTRNHLLQGSHHLKLGNWPEAVREFQAAKDLGTQVNKQLADSLGLAYFYSGDFASAASTFDDSISAAAAELEANFPNPEKMRKAAISRLGADSSPWARFFIQPTSEIANPFVEAYRQFTLSPSIDSFKKIPASSNFQEKTATAQASLILAHRNPAAVGQALSDAEELFQTGPEGKTLGPWFISHALLIHGKQAVANGKAVLAEGLFQAAKEQSQQLTFEKRRAVLEFRCDKALGELLSKWEKREDRGVEILSSISGKFNLGKIADASELFLPPPTNFQ